MAGRGDRKKVLKALLSKTISLYRVTRLYHWETCLKPYAERMAVYQEYFEKQGPFHDEEGVKRFFGVDHDGDIPLPVDMIAAIFSELYAEVQCCDPKDKPQMQRPSGQPDNIDEIYEQVRGEAPDMVNTTYWPEDKDFLLRLSPSQVKDVHEPHFPHSQKLPFGVSYADIDTFNKMFAAVKRDIASGQDGLDETSEPVPYSFTILSKNNYERTQEHYGDGFGFYAPDHYYQRLVKYQVLVDKEKRGVSFCDFADHQTVSYSEKEIVSIFNGVWEGLPEFLESLLVTWIDYLDDFKKLRLCRHCREIFYAPRGGPERGFFCPSEYGTNCQQSCHASQVSTRCRERNCKRIARKVAELEVWVEERLFVDKMTTSICKNGNCPFVGEPPLESACPHLLNANRKTLERYEAEKIKRQEGAGT
nr:hypothetical protein [uncultured Pseudodesulfovibrio sp.]